MTGVEGQGPGIFSKQEASQSLRFQQRNPSAWMVDLRPDLNLKAFMLAPAATVDRCQH